MIMTDLNLIKQIKFLADANISKNLDDIIAPMSQEDKENFVNSMVSLSQISQHIIKRNCCNDDLELKVG